ncbi:hypothetical protein T265_00520 [Opisthorchis viverrini]|uniref:Uncharacterized protein n=1 Tax=Opisthorchis viverrini TaxID=6198 RepID=A0A075AJM2_OPIVI|nr:hypothetical protein T265_00520 [Opisthorchis viverrini]KER33629.1 hypothetical protein T265_00520 [Opisthorchis viverrini]
MAPSDRLSPEQSLLIHVVIAGTTLIVRCVWRTSPSGMFATPLITGRIEFIMHWQLGNDIPLSLCQPSAPESGHEGLDSPELYDHSDRRI